jgi:hypothetical protein
VRRLEQGREHQMPTAQRALNTGNVAKWAAMVRRNLNHHGVGVRATVPAIVGFVLMYHDGGTLQVSAGQKYSNFGSAEFRGRRLAFCYNHNDQCVDVRDGDFRGETIRQFHDGERDEQAMLRFFRGLVPTKRSA